MIDGESNQDAQWHKPMRFLASSLFTEDNCSVDEHASDYYSP